MGPAKISKLGLSAISIFAFPAAVFAQQALIRVDLNHPDFAQARSVAPGEAMGLSAPVRSAAAKLKVPLVIPVPSQSVRTLGVEPALSKTSLLTDENNPVWYHYENEFPGVTVSVDADLRIQNSFPETHPIYGESAQEAAIPTTELLMAEPTDEGMEDGIAQYTVTRYNVPYTVTVVCDRPGSEPCTRILNLARSADFLQLAAAPAN